MQKKYKINEKSLGAKHANVLHSKVQKLTKTKYRQALRQDRLRENLERYKKLDSIFSKPSSAYSYLRSCRQSKATRIDQLSVGEKMYTGAAVCDGFYDSMTTLKQCDLEQLRSDPHLSSQFNKYDHIVKCD